MPPTNISFATATEISAFPAAITQDVVSGGAAVTVFFTYIHPAGCDAVGVWPFGGTVGSGYRPRVHAFDADHNLWPTDVGISDTRNVPVQIPGVPGQRYFFTIDPVSAGVSPADLTLSVVTHQRQHVRRGDILITDDFGAAAIILSPDADYTVRHLALKMPTSGEQGDVLANGRLLRRPRVLFYRL